MAAAFAVIGLTLSTHASADDADDVIAVLSAQDIAVAAIGERLRVAAAPLCADRVYSSGMIVQSLSQYGRDYRAAARRRLSLDSLPAVVYVDPAGPADRAGLRRGDSIVSIDGQRMPQVALDAVPRIDDSQAAMDGIDAALADGTAQVRLIRGKDHMVTTLRGRSACHARFEVRAGRGANADADRHRVQVSSDLVDPARGDAGLAPLLAHELAHIVLRHPERLKRQYGGLLPGFGAGGAALRASEIDADRLSVYLLDMAGFDPNDAVAFWSRFGRANDHGIFSDRTHPDWRKRVAAIRAELTLIARDRAAGRKPAIPSDLIAPAPSG